MSLLTNKNLGRIETEALVVRVYGLEKKEFHIGASHSFMSGVLRKLAEKMVEFGGLNPTRVEDVEDFKKDDIARMVVAHKDTDLKTLEFIFHLKFINVETKVEALLHPNARGKAREWVGSGAENPAGLMGLWMMILKAEGVGQDVTSEMLAKWTPQMNGALAIAAQLIAHPTVSEVDAIALGKKCESYDRWSHNDKAGVRRALAAIDGVRKEKEIWEILKSSQNQSVLIGMVEGARDTAEFSRAVKRLRNSSAAKLLQVLKELQLAPGIVPPQKLLAPILASGDGKERETAIGILGRWGRAGREEKTLDKPSVKR